MKTKYFKLEINFIELENILILKINIKGDFSIVLMNSLK